ncbi:hypothetical protein pipiens_005232 [Culex pipiens pipiens]|uniref:Fibrinogen C-terminal domain-containing protein n=1 Tax=Culex pipiens pipiens TaxID=38569 RepID=A0ABD1DYE9_CULPP
MLEILQLLHHQVIGIDSCASVPSPGLYKLACERCPKLPTILCANGSLGGGWLVIQQRLDGSVDFNRYWDDYRNGFGTIGRGSEFWLGLEQIHQITANGDYELAVELKGESGLYGFARYSQFRLAGETERYRISALGQYSGTIGDKLSQHRDLPFSTRDRDHDQSGTSCAEYYSGGWWYKSCASCLVQFHVASSRKLSDQYIEIDFDQLQQGQQVSTAITKNPRRYIQSCDEAHTSGVYELRLSTKSVPFTAYCDVESLYGKWLVFEQRVDGSVDFNRSWVQYRDGFGGGWRIDRVLARAGKDSSSHSQWKL